MKHCGTSVNLFPLHFSPLHFFTNSRPCARADLGYDAAMLSWKALFDRHPDVPAEKLRWWLSDFLDVSLTMLPWGTVPSPAERTAFEAATARLQGGEPVQYVCGKAPFWDFEVYVTPEVLIPRPETEQLVQLALEVAVSAGKKVLDVGTGSGCIAIALKRACPKCVVSGVDVSEAALAVARENALRLGVEVGFHSGDLLGAEADRSLDVLVANLPYIGETEREDLPREVRDFEPALALFSGADGTDLVVRLLDEARRVLKNQGKIVLETGESQGHVYALAAERFGWRLENRSDLAGRPRFWILERPHV